MTRAHRSLWILTALTVLATGLTAQALAQPAGLGTHLQLAAGLLLLTVSATLLIRVLRYLIRPAPPGPRAGEPGGPPAVPDHRAGRPGSRTRRPTRR